MSNSSSIEEISGSANIGTPTANNVITGKIPNPSMTAQSSSNSGQNTGGQVVAPDFMEVARRATVATAMSSEGSKYVRLLKEYLADKSTGAMKAEVRPLAYPAEAIAVSVKEFNQVLLFQEAWHRSDNLPVIAGVKDALTCLQTSYGSENKMTNSIVVTPNDYPKVETMGATLLNTFIARISPEVRALTIDSLQPYDIELSLQPNVYDSFVNRYNPHAVPSLAPLTITVYLSKKKKIGSNADMFTLAEDAKIEIGAIGAYVQFSRGPNNSKFVPEIHISELTAAMPFTGIMTLLLSIATSILLDNGHWKTQFNDLSPNAPNIGNLIMDQSTGAPMRVENMAQRKFVFDTFCEPPVLILDVVEGRYRIPGVELFAVGDGGQRLINLFNAFLGKNPLGTNTNPGMMYAKAYIGTIGHSGVPYDSRYVNYLNMMIHHQSDPNVQALLSQPRRPEDAANIVRMFCKDFQSLYLNQLIILQADIIREVQRRINSCIRVTNGPIDAGIVDSSILLNASNAFSATQNTVGFAAPGNQYLMNTIYGANAQGGNLFA